MKPIRELRKEDIKDIKMIVFDVDGCWYKGKIYQHVNSFDALRGVFPKLKSAAE